MNENLTIRPIGENDLPASLGLVLRVFDVFEAPGYSPEGIATFKAFVAQGAIAKKMRDGTLLLWGCFAGGEVLGVIALSPPGHISLLFVDAAHHRRGIARALWATAQVWRREHGYTGAATVNASPFAVPAYQRLGFAQTGPEQVKNGIRFTPMVCPAEPPAKPQNSPGGTAQAPATTLEILAESFAVCKLLPGAAIPAIGGTFIFTAQTNDEVSLVCEEAQVPAGTLAVAPGWRCLKVKGPLDFSLVGILAGLSGVLAAGDVSVFAVSTFDTDYLLLRSADLAKAITLLAKAGYRLS